MAILVIAEHDNAALKSATLHVVGAAARLGSPIHVLVAGSAAQGAAQAAAQAAGVAKSIHVDAPHLAQPTAENLAAQVLAIVQDGGYTHVVAPATGYGRNVAPRIAAKLDVAQV
ncbi:MAG: electron transfer flavoprotein subunit alpha/FixB family protein, partial [Betaproteobacteria bacterium]|nr:electron transfer flavoprotein subunit alpha/FixB family protein [Betaproteobacteria bacterium]